MKLFCPIVLAVALIVTLAARAENVPQWRGADRSGIVPDKGLAAAWPEGGPKKLWSLKVGIGFATPVAADGKIYFFNLDGGNDVLEAVDAAKGTSLWKQSYPRGYNDSYKGTRASPVIDGNRIYTYGGNSQLVAWNLADGKQAWMVDVFKETGGHNKQWGMASNPLIDGDRIFVQSGEGGNAAICVDKNTGKVLWKSQPTGGGYASPAMATVGGAKQLILFAHKHVLAVAPDTGKLLWELNEPWETQYDVNAALPVIVDNKMFITNAYSNAKCGLYELTDDGPKKLWGAKEITGRFQAPIHDNGYLYGNSEGLLKCVDIKTGKTTWTERNLLGIGGSMVRFGDKMILLSERGKLTLGQATPEKFTKISQMDSAVDGKQVWSSPLVYEGKLVVKGEDEAICYDISGK